MSYKQRIKQILLTSIIYTILYIINQILILITSITKALKHIKSKTQHIINSKLFLSSPSQIITKVLYNKKIPSHIGIILKRLDKFKLYSIIKYCEYAHISTITLYDAYTLYNQEEIEKYIKDSNSKVLIMYYDTKKANSDMIKSFLYQSFRMRKDSARLDKKMHIQKCLTKKDDVSLPSVVLNFYESDEDVRLFNSVNLVGFPYLLMESCEIM